MDDAGVDLSASPSHFFAEALILDLLLQSEELLVKPWSFRRCRRSIAITTA